eukprot:gene28382-37462_t
MSITSLTKSIQPVIVGTWEFSAIAITKSIPVLINGGSAVDAIELGIREVELNTDDQYFVGVGGLPNSEGVMELDAAIMDHKLRYGAVMGITDIKTPISVARTVMEKCVHNILCGEGALKWALENGFTKEKDVLTESSHLEWLNWKNGRDNTIEQHDTIGLICMDKDGNLAAGTSTSGWKFKHPGRVGDSPIIGSGIYCDGEVGAAVATGDGEEIMRCCLSFLAVEYIRLGYSPQDACNMCIDRISKVSSFTKDCNTVDGSSELTQHKMLTVGIIAMDKHGNIGSSSTLSDLNQHRHRNYFPAMYWKGDFDLTNIQTLKASVN